MKILFIVNIEDLGFEEPLGVLYLSAACKKHGHRVYAVDNDLTKIEEKIRAIRPELIAVSVLTPNFSYLYESIKEIKSRFDIPTVFGGPHITFFPEAVRCKEIDYAFRGEGEEVFVDFLNLLQAGKPVDELDNLILQEDAGRARQNRLRPLVSNLDILPFPDRELLINYKQFYEVDVRSVIASRGCVYECSYCFNRDYHKLYAGLGDRMRLRSVDNVVEECLELKNIYKAKMIHFFDDIFPFQKDWLEEFSDKYAQKVTLPFFTNTRFCVCNEDYVRNLSRAGCKTLLIGVETGNEKLREEILHRKMTNKMMIERAKLIHDYGIKIYTQNIIGLPFGSLEKDMETVKLNIDLKADFAGAYLCHPYPKTEIEKIARRANLLEPSYDVSRSFYYSSPLNLPDKKDIEKLRMVFAVIVNFPFLFKYSRLLLRFPDFLFKVISSFLHGYKIKTVILRYQMSWKVFFKNIRMFFLRRINCVFDREAEVK